MGTALVNAAPSTDAGSETDTGSETNTALVNAAPCTDTGSESDTGSETRLGLILGLCGATFVVIIMLYIAVRRRRDQVRQPAIPNQVEPAKIQNRLFVAKRVKNDYFVEKKEEEDDRRALFHALDRFREQKAVPDILAGMLTMKDLFDPPNRVVAAFLACPGGMDAENELFGEGDVGAASRANVWFTAPGSQISPGNMPGRRRDPRCVLMSLFIVRTRTTWL